MQHIKGKWRQEFIAFVEIFDKWLCQPGMRGAACLMHNHKILIDIWGGWASKNVMWEENTKACCFSVSKGVLSLVAHRLLDASIFKLSTPISDIWPKFAENGKKEVTLADVMSHQSGLPTVSTRVESGDIYNWDKMISHLEGSSFTVPFRGPPVYHNMTYGHLLGETLREATKSSSLSSLIDQTVSDPLSIDFTLGTSGQEPCAELSQEDPELLIKTLKTEPDSLFAQSMKFFGKNEDFNSNAWRCSEIGSGNGHATARALAKIYGQFVWNGSVISASRQNSLRQETARSLGYDPILGIPIRYGQGVQLSHSPFIDFGPNKATLGHWGAGGAQAWSDERTGLSFAFISGHMSAKMGSSEPAISLSHKSFDIFSKILPSSL